MHYDDTWEKLHAAQLESKNVASQNRKELLEALTTEEMIRILFEHHINKLSDIKVNDLKKEYIDCKEVLNK